MPKSYLPLSLVPESMVDGDGDGVGGAEVARTQSHIFWRKSDEKPKIVRPMPSSPDQREEEEPQTSQLPE